MHRILRAVVSCLLCVLVGCSTNAPATPSTTSVEAKPDRPAMTNTADAGAPPAATPTSASVPIPTQAPTTMPEKPAAPAMAPFRINASVDAEKAAVAVIPLSGGVIEAVGADGTAYRLEVPPAALETTTTITMTPIVQFNGLPVGERTLGVHLAPNGLQAYRFLTLTIRPQGEYPLHQALYFSFDDAEGRLRPSPSPLRRTSLEIPILHFSSHASTVLTAQQTESVLASNRSDPTSTMHAELSRVLHEARSSGDGSLTDEHRAKIEALFTEYRRTVLLPAIEEGLREGGDAALRTIRLLLEQARYEELFGTTDNAAMELLLRHGAALLSAQLRAALAGAGGASCDGLTNATRLILQNERTRELLGLNDGQFFGLDHVQEFAVARLLTCVLEEYERCLSEHVVHRMPFVWLDHMRQLELSGFPDEMPIEGAAIEALSHRSPVRISYAMVKSCLTLRLDFRSSARFEKEGGGFEADVEAENPLPPTLEPVSNPSWQGVTALNSKRFKFFGPAPCTWSGIPGGGTFEAYEMKMILDLSLADPYMAGIKDYRLTYFPGKTSESFTADCPNAPRYTAPQEPMWTGVFNALHQNEGVPPIVVNWELLTGSEVLARKEWDLANAGPGLQERGKLEIVHTPSPLPMDQLRENVRTTSQNAIDRVQRAIAPQPMR